MPFSDKEDVKEQVYLRVLRTIQFRKKKRKFIRLGSTVLLLSCVLSVAYLWRTYSYEERHKGQHLYADISAGQLTLSGKGTIDIRDCADKKDLPFDVKFEKDMVVISAANRLHEAADEVTLKVGVGGFYKVILDDGTVIYLNSNSELKYRGNLKADRVVRLRGEAYFEVATRKVKGVKQDFTVLTDKQRIQVVGTQFSVTSRVGEEQTILTEGAVLLESIRNGEVTKVFPGERVQIANGGDLLKSKVDVEEYVSWKDGFLYFEDQSLLRILEALQHVYAIQFDPNTVPRKNFTIYLKRDRPFSDIINVLEKAGGFSIHLADDKVIFTK